MDDLENLWGTLLSGDPAQIKSAWKGLSEDEARSVRAHLQKMAGDEGYSEAQKEAARQALTVIEAED